MSDHLAADSKCCDCAFWIRTDKKGGNCRRRAPRPSSDADEIARWPRTNDDDGCGEWLLKTEDGTPLIRCGDCSYWRHMAEGIQPVDSQDHFSDWWRRAGKCHRFAPQPSSLSGSRAFWSATNQGDVCSEGQLLTRKSP